MILETLAFGAGAAIGQAVTLGVAGAIDSEREEEARENYERSYNDWYNNVHMAEMRRIAACNPDDPPSSCFCMR